jgi:nitrite reductase/ring-hydroxylating ferredoxin subunit
VDYASDTLNVVAQYGDWLSAADVDSRDQIAPGSGATIRKGASRTAVYRDERGTLHEFSAVCPHLGGLVSWNEAEKSWDCPCHGSRFDCFGHVVDGPANRDLDGPDDPLSVLTAAELGMKTGALMAANGLKKLVTLEIRRGN